MKRIVRLTESQLRGMIQEAVNSALNELGDDFYYDLDGFDINRYLLRRYYEIENEIAKIKGEPTCEVDESFIDSWAQRNDFETCYDMVTEISDECRKLGGKNLFRDEEVNEYLAEIYLHFVSKINGTPINRSMIKTLAQKNDVDTLHCMIVNVEEEWMRILNER